MSRLPSTETQLKTTRRIANELKAECTSLRQQRDTYQARLVAKTKECEEWKKRFDTLLEKMGVQDPDPL